jgi:predicted amidohydrolase YtcJ
MTRTIFAGATVFDGTGSAPTVGDVAVEDGRFVEVGVGLDGDEGVDLRGKGLLPGMFDCHTHVTVSSIDLLQNLQTPFSYRFFRAAANL